MTEQCNHNNVRKIVHIIADVPADCNRLDKTTIRSHNVKIIGVDWDKLTDHWCGDCGIIMCKVQQYSDVFEELNNPASKLNRIKATRKFTGLLIKEAMLFVDEAFTNDGYGELKEAYSHMTSQDIIDHMTQ